MMKLNCWEYKKCGREPGGFQESKLGTCPATTFQVVDGFNNGKNGGRICWGINGTFCKDIAGIFVKKIDSCILCDFYLLVVNEEMSVSK
jgi:hypothetical protein